MPRTIIGLDITEDIVAAVQVKSLMQGYQIIGCSAVPIEEAGGTEAAVRAVCEKLDFKGSACNSAVEDGHVAFKNLGMPFNDLRKIRQTLGFELETVMASSIDKHIVDFIDIGRSGAGTDIIAAAVKRDYLRTHLASLAEQGIEPEILGIRNVSLTNQIILQPNNPPNGMLLYLGSQSCTIVLFLDRKIVLIRQLPFSCQDLRTSAYQAAMQENLEQPDAQDFVPGLISLCRTITLTLRGFQVEGGNNLGPEKVFLTGSGGLVPGVADITARELGIPVSLLNLPETVENIQLGPDLGNSYIPQLMDNGLALAIRESRKGKGFNFRREEFQVTTQFVKLKKELIHASIYGTIILVLFCINLGVSYHDLKKRTSNLDNQIKAIFTQTFPEITAIVDPMQQMKTRISELKEASGAAPGITSQGTILGILNDISSRIPGGLELQVDRLVIDPEGIQLRGTTDTFNTVDAIKKGLESSTMYKDVTIASANLDKSGKGVRFEIKMEQER
jgi:general secretion pathway protein L